MRASLYRDGKQLRPFSITMARVDETKLHVVEISELRAMREAEKRWRRDNKPKVIRVELEKAA